MKQLIQKITFSNSFNKAEFKPHEKSMSLIHLAKHVTEIGGWWKECLLQDELDFAKDSGERNK
jgi:hypothetical protein